MVGLEEGVDVNDRRGREIGDVMLLLVSNMSDHAFIKFGVEIHQ